MYLSLYIVLSRKAFAYSREIGIDGFWFVVPLTDETRRQNDLRNTIFWPAVWIDWAIGTGMKPLCNPMIDMSGPEQSSGTDDQIEADAPH